MPDPSIEMSDLIIDDLDHLLAQFAAGISGAQRQLDRASLESQAELATLDKGLADLGYRVPWYFIPQAEIELKVAVHVEEKTESDGKKRKGLFFSPFNSKWQNSSSFVADGASTVKLKIVPIPAPDASEPVA